MRTHRSAAAARSELEWWKEQLEREDRAALRDNCAACTRANLRVFQAENADLIEAALGTTRTRREALVRQAKDEMTRQMLLLSAYQRLATAIHWMDAVGPFAEDHLMGRASPARIQLSLHAMDRFLTEWPAYWPFDDGTDPLCEGLLADASDE